MVKEENEYINTLILTKEGFKQLTNIRVGDTVASGDKDFHVIASISKTNEKTIKIVTSNCHCVEIPGKYELYLRKKSFVNVNNNGHTTTKRLFSRPEWIKAENLSKNYFVGYPVNQNSIIPSWDGVEYIRGRSKYIKKMLNMEDENLWYLVGRFLGDGWIKTRKDRNNHISGLIICTSKINGEDEAFESKIPEWAHYNKINDSTTYKYQFPNKELATFCNLFGKGADGKFIPGFVFDMPIDLISKLLEGYLDSDGCCINNLYKVTSVSKKLIYGVGQLVAKTYHVPFSIYKTQKSKEDFIQGRKVTQKSSYELTWRLEANKRAAFYENGYIWSPVKKIERINSFSDVYNIKINENGSFIANGCIVRITDNCKGDI